MFKNFFEKEKGSGPNQTIAPSAAALAAFLAAAPLSAQPPITPDNADVIMNDANTRARQTERSLKKALETARLTLTPEERAEITQSWLENAHKGEEMTIEKWEDRKILENCSKYPDSAVCRAYQASKEAHAEMARVREAVDAVLAQEKNSGRN